MPATSPVVLVTGAARRIGAAIARHLHACGYQVVLHYRHSRAEAEALASALHAARSGSACALAADLAHPGECARLIEEAARWQGRLDAVVNNASSFFRTPLAEADEQAWTELIDGNLKAAFFVSRHAAPWLQSSGGAIVNLCDVHTERPLPGFSVYTAAKAGMVSLARTRTGAAGAGQCGLARLAHLAGRRHLLGRRAGSRGSGHPAGADRHRRGHRAGRPLPARRQ
jgi:pteridine reductase